MNKDQTVELLALTMFSLVISSATPLLQAEITDDLLYYAPFEGDARPLVAVGYSKLAVPGPAKFSRGRFGQGLVVEGGKAKPGFAFYAETNICKEQGTVAFWVKPNWTGNDTRFAHRMVAQIVSGGNSGWLLHFNRRYRTLIFATGYVDENGWHWLWKPGASIANWKAGEWRHIALTWEITPNGFAKKIFLDGKLAAEHLLARKNQPSLIPQGGIFYLGTRGAEGAADGIYDELTVWGRALSAEEIAELPAGAAQEALRTIPQREATRNRLKSASATTDHPGNAYLEGEPISITLNCRLHDDAEPVSSYSWEVRDFYGDVTASGDFKSQKHLRGVKERRLNIGVPSRRGVFKFILHLPKKNGHFEEARDLTTFAVLPRSLAEAEPSVDSPFGGHLWWEQQEYHCALGRKIGVRWVRFHDLCNATWWIHAEPEPGRWRWYDDVVDLYIKYGFHIVGTFAKTPYWASTAPAGLPKESHEHFAYPPRDLNAFANYVTKVVNHYKGRIHVWEVWNEPHHGGFWHGTPQQYGELLKVAYKAAKASDPSCTIIGGGGITIRDHAFLKGMLETGALDYMDVLSIHYYDDANVMRPGELTSLQKFQALIKPYGEPPPIWNTEQAVWSASFLKQYQRGFDAEKYNYRAASYHMVRTLVTNLAHGIRKVFYYAMWNRRNSEERLRNPVSQNMLEPPGSLMPMSVAYATTVDHLDGAAFLTSVTIGDNVVAHIFRSAKSSIAVIWLHGEHVSDETSRKLALPSTNAQLPIFDVMNNPRDLLKGNRVELPLAEEPFFIDSAQLSADQLAKFLTRGKIIVASPP